MILRSPRARALRSAALPVLLYGGGSYAFLYWLRALHQLHPQVLLVFGVLAFWRYGWQLLHILRAAWYGAWHYPRLRAAAARVAASGRGPRRVFIVLPSYMEEAWVSTECMQALMSNIAALPCKATIIAAVGSDADEAAIGQAWQAHPGRDKVELVFQRQSQGKRIALGHALRAVARRYDDEPDSVTVLMDGDTWLGPGTLARVLPFFGAFADLGAVTTNEVAFIPGRSAWYRDWFGLKFGLRHVFFQSHSLSHRVLTLTGRFSAFRTSMVVQEDFLQMIEHDTIDHWLHGRFRFLMGDDKSSWFYVLRAGWKMLYLPDITVVSLESRETSFLRASVQLPYRWFGNTMRNNPRALALGPWRTGLFMWLVLLDQRISMWTSLVGITGATVMAVVKSPIYLPLYIGWAALVRSVQLLVIAANGHPVTMRTVPLMLYTHWVGAVVKIRAWHHLADQSWSKGGRAQAVRVGGGWLKRLGPTVTMVTAYLAFAIVILVTHGALRWPGLALFATPAHAAERPPAQELVLRGVRPDDGQDDAAALQSLIDQAPPGPVTVRLPAGTLDFMQPLVVTRDDVTIIGAGRDRTRIVSHLKAPAPAVIQVEGRQGKRIATLAQAMGPDDRTLHASVPLNAPPGSLLFVREPNDDAFLQAIGSRRWHREYPYLRQALVKVAGGQGATLQLEQPTGLTLDAGKTEIAIARPVRRVHLADFSIEQLADGRDIASVRHVYENVLPDYQVDGIGLMWTQDAVIERVAVRQAGRHPVSFEQSYGFLLRDCLLDGAWNKGDKGSGYLRIARSDRGLVEGCTVRDIRHIALQWSAGFNRIRDIDSEVDVNFHGGYDHHNSVANVHFAIPPQHHWGPIYVTPPDAHWAPPDGPGNLVDGRPLNTVATASGQ